MSWDLIFGISLLDPSFAHSMGPSVSSSIAAAAGIVGSRCTYVGPILAASSSSFTPTSSSSYSAAETSFLKDVSDHAKSLVKSLKRRPYLHIVAKLEPVVGVVDEGEALDDGGGGGFEGEGRLIREK